MQLAATLVRFRSTGTASKYRGVCPITSIICSSHNDNNNTTTEDKNDCMEEENSRRSIEEENSQCSIEEENSQRSNGLDWDDFNNEEQGVSTEMFEELLNLDTATSDCVQQSTLLLDLYIATHSLEHPLALLSLLIPHWHNLACTVLYEGRLQTLLQLDQEQFKHWNLELIDLLLDDSRYNLNLDCNITTLWNPVYESVNRSQLKALSHLLLQACTKQKMNPVVLHYKK